MAVVGQIATLLERLAARIDQETAETIDRAYELRFVGEDQRWYLDLTRRADFLSTEAPDCETCSMGMSEQDLDDLISGHASMGMLFSVGRLRVFGNIGDAMKLEPIFKPR